MSGGKQELCRAAPLTPPASQDPSREKPQPSRAGTSPSPRAGQKQGIIPPAPGTRRWTRVTAPRPPAPCPPVHLVTEQAQGLPSTPPCPCGWAGSPEAGTAPLQSTALQEDPGAEGNFVRDGEKSDSSPWGKPQAQRGKGSRVGPACRPSVQESPMAKHSSMPSRQGKLSFAECQHQCQASQTLLCSPSPSQQNQRSVSRILLESGVCPAIPGCSEGQEQDPQADLSQGQPARAGQGCLPHVRACQNPAGSHVCGCHVQPGASSASTPTELCWAGEQGAVFPAQQQLHVPQQLWAQLSSSGEPARC